MFGFIRKLKRQKERRSERREGSEEEEGMFPIVDRPTPIIDAVRKRMDKDENPLESAGRRFRKK